MILSVGEISYTTEERFRPLHEAGSDVWMLKITRAQVEDSGEYECQLSYHDDEEAKLKISFKLDVLGEFEINSS